MDGSVIDISSVKRAHHITFLLSNCCICGMEYWDKTFCYYSICKKYVITLHTCDSTAVWRECRTSQCVFAIKPNRGLCTYSMYLHTFWESVMIPRDLVRMKSPVHSGYSSYFVQRH